MSPLFRRCLIANRGEIAVRIAHALAELGIESVAVYSDADAGALHTRVADRAVHVGGAAAANSYLRLDRLLEVAAAHGCDALHPGYGFLSERAELAEALAEAGVRFIGPSAEVIRTMGDKIEARRAMSAAGVPVVPGCEGEGDALVAEAQKLPLPLLVKAAAGGGGKGMRLVKDSAELPEAIAAASREALAAFGDGAVYVERFIERARHIEIQVLGDSHGRAVHLGERECSVQRRHQKIVEEAPSPLIDEALRAEMGAASVRAAEAVGYEGAGTVEFIVDPDTREWFFLEMNTRLQVEHPVTELVYGIDLVKAQLRVAAGEALWLTQDDITPRGHAIECRIYAEDVEAGFLPAPGPVLAAVVPAGPGVRVDAGVEGGDEVSVHYDPMIAKLIVSDADRPSAIGRMRKALADYALLGLTHNIPFLDAVLAHETFVAGEATTGWVGETFSKWRAPAPKEPDAAILLAVADELLSGAAAGNTSTEGAADTDRHSPWDRGDGFRLGGA